MDSATRNEKAQEFGLSKGQARVALGIAVGMSNKDLSDHLGITVKAVKFHVTSVAKILKVKSRLQIALLMNGVSYE